MSIENLISILMNVTEKYKEYKQDSKTEQIYYEVLHVSITEAVNTFSKESWSKAPLTVRSTVEKISELILKETSDEYKRNREQDVQQNTEKSNQTINHPQSVKKRIPIGFAHEDLQR